MICFSQKFLKSQEKEVSLKCDKIKLLIQEMQVTFDEIDALILQLNQIVTTDCQLMYPFCTSSCFCNNLMYKVGLGKVIEKLVIKFWFN